MKKWLKLTSILTMMSMTSANVIISQQITSYQSSSFFLNQDEIKNINKNIYQMVYKKITIAGQIFVAKQENYDLYLSTNAINDLVNYYQSHNYEETVLKVYSTINSFLSTFEPQQPADWIRIQEDIAKELYYTITSCQGSETGVIVRFGKLSIPIFPRQDWGLTNIDNQ